ncbi:MAG: DEAD/DEAH box helicase, partial [Bacteroidales bacterium]|nr:DEAD/DEAH box helicase [Bacteroidales bacterium]
MEINNEFRQLGLSEKALLAIKKKGFEQPSPIQKITIPVLLSESCDIIAQA